MFSKKIKYGYIILKRLQLTINGEIKLGKEILEDTGIPYNMGLGILTELSNAGLIVSIKGKNGGFFLAKEQISFLDLFIALEASKGSFMSLFVKGKSEEYDEKIQKIGNALVKELQKVRVI